MTKLYDAWDKKIFAQIEFNYLLSHREIARRIKRSKSFVSYRIKKLEENRVISYQPLIDYSRLGYSYFRIFIETILSKDELLAKLQGLDLKTAWLVERYDKENFAFTLLTKGPSQFHAVWESIYARLAGDIIAKDIHIVFLVHHLPSTFFHGKSGLRMAYATGGAQVARYTPDDELLLDALAKDPMISMRELENKTHRGQPALRKTIDRLQKDRILLAYQALLNKDILGIRHHKVYLEFDFTKAAKNRLIELLKDSPHVVYVTQSSFTHDLEFETLTFNDQELHSLIKHLKSEFPIKRLILSQTLSEEKLS